nr:MAG TPA: hypothetical protein [Caudoviricetes sp.]
MFFDEVIEVFRKNVYHFFSFSLRYLYIIP